MLTVWLAAHWLQIVASLVVLGGVVPTIAVGLKEAPLPGEGRLHFVWRVWGRLAWTTFKNLGTVWGFEFKMPLAEQPATMAPRPVSPDPAKP